MPASIAAIAPVAVIKNTAGVRRTRSSDTKNQRDQDGGREKHLQRMLLRKGDDLRAPASEQKSRQPIRRYFSDEFTEVKLLFSVEPMPLTATTITMLMPAAIRQYSMAVAPDSSPKNFEKRRRIQNSCRRTTGFSRAYV